jgi:hypothetical protein
VAPGRVRKISPPSGFEPQAVQGRSMYSQVHFYKFRFVTVYPDRLFRTLPSHHTNGADDLEVCHDNFKSKSTSNDTKYLNKIINTVSATQ